VVLKFDLDLAHQSCEAPLRHGFEKLHAKWPGVKLRGVAIVPPKRDGDISMGHYDEETGDVGLNSYWFSQPIEILRGAATAPPAFHGAMTAEPDHVIAHEFGHAVEWTRPEIRPRLHQVWERATRQPDQCFAQYALTNPCEYWGELFALVSLGLESRAQHSEYIWILSGRHEHAA